MVKTSTALRTGCYCDGKRRPHLMIQSKQESRSCGRDVKNMPIPSQLFNNIEFRGQNQFSIHSPMRRNEIADPATRSLNSLDLYRFQCSIYLWLARVSAGSDSASTENYSWRAVGREIDLSRGFPSPWSCPSALGSFILAILTAGSNSALCGPRPLAAAMRRLLSWN